MSALQAEMYAKHKGPDTYFILKKHNSLDTFFESRELGVALCNIVAACKDGKEVPSDKVLKTFCIAKR